MKKQIEKDVEEIFGGEIYYTSVRGTDLCFTYYTTKEITVVQRKNGESRYRPEVTFKTLMSLSNYLGTQEIDFDPDAERWGESSYSGCEKYFQFACRNCKIDLD